MAELLASCWTWAGDAGPGSGDEISPVPLARRIAAAAAAGFTGVGFSHADLMALRDVHGVATVRTMLHDVGIDRVEVEMLNDWWLPDERGRRAREVEADLLGSAPELGVSALKVGAWGPHRSRHAEPSGERFAASFDELATRAAGEGVAVALEPMSRTNLPVFAAAVEFVRGVGNPNGGLAVDVCQLAKTGDTDWELLPELLEGVPVFVVELGDAPVDVARSGDPEADFGVGPRCLPGNGDIDPTRFIAAMLQTGWSGVWGAEIISEELRALPVETGLAHVAAWCRDRIGAAEALVANSPAT